MWELIYVLVAIAGLAALGAVAVSISELSRQLSDRPVDNKEQHRSSILETYIDRPPVESVCLERMSQPRSLIPIRAPLHFGKTQLLHRLLSEASDRGQTTVYLSFASSYGAAFLSAASLLSLLCLAIARQLDLSIPEAESLAKDMENGREPANAWGEVERWTKYLEKYVLGERANSLVLAIDDIDALASCPEALNAFLALAKYWHEIPRLVFDKLRVVLAYTSAIDLAILAGGSDRYLLMLDAEVALDDFQLEQVQSLARKYGLDLDTSEVEQLMAVVGGHPYLLNKMFSHAQQEAIAVPEILTAGIYGDYLERLWFDIQNNARVKESAKLLSEADTDAPVESTARLSLEALGLVRRGQGDRLCWRYPLYRNYFRDRFENQQSAQLELGNSDRDRKLSFPRARRYLSQTL